jgi:hypothetical protein
MKRLVNAAQFVSVQKWLTWPTIDEWIDESQTIVIVGEAARPMVVSCLFPIMRLGDYPLSSVCNNSHVVRTEQATLLKPPP